MLFTVACISFLLKFVAGKSANEQDVLDAFTEVSMTSLLAHNVKFSKNVNNKNCAPKIIFFNGKKSKKDLDDF